MKCKTCGREFHYCSSCDYDRYLFEGYCDKTCYEGSDEWKLFSVKVQKFYDSLSKYQQLELWSLWDNGIFVADNWEHYLDTIIIDPRDPNE